MAPIPLQLFPRVVYHHSTTNGGAIGGGVIAAIFAIIVFVFVCVYIYEYMKAQRLQADTNIPISHGKIFKRAAIVALTLGLVGLLCAECCDGSSSGNTGSNRRGGGANNQTYEPAPQMGSTGEGGFVPQPMPSYQPQMDYTPISSAAQDGVQ